MEKQIKEAIELLKKWRREGYQHFAIIWYANDDFRCKRLKIDDINLPKEHNTDGQETSIIAIPKEEDIPNFDLTKGFTDKEGTPLTTILIGAIGYLAVAKAKDWIIES